SGQAANDATVADLIANALDSRFPECPHGPIAATAGNLADEVGENRRSPRRVHHLGMELDAVEPPLLISNCCEGCVRRDGHDLKPRRQLLDAIAVAHPDLVAGAL